MAKLGRICEALTTPFTILCTLIYAHSTASVWQYAVCRMQSVACINPPINQRDFKVAKHLSATRSAYMYLPEPSPLKGNSKSTRTFVNLSLRFVQS